MTIYHNGDHITVEVRVMGKYDSNDPNFIRLQIGDLWVTKKHEVMIHKDQIIAHKPRQPKVGDRVKLKGFEHLSDAIFKVLNIYEDNAWVKLELDEKDKIHKPAPLTVKIDNLEKVA